MSPQLVDIYTVGDHVISCLLENLPEKQVGVQWTPETQQADKYDLNDGNLVGNTQESTLTISNSQLKTLVSSSKSHTFTCAVMFGSSASPFTATQTVTIYDPGVTLTGLGVVSDSVPVTLSCVVSEIFKASSVSWYGGDISSSGITESTAKYTLSSGTYNEIDHSQVHSITISTDALSSIGSTTTFTCSFDPESLNLPITAEQPLTIVSPAITLQPISTSVNQGDVLTLNCKGTGVDPSLMDVTSFWTHNDKNVDPSLITTTSVTTSEVESKLEFSNVESEMSGDYKCGIDYGGGRISSQAASIVVAGMISFPSSSLVVEGNSLTISMVTLTPSSAKSVAWYNNSVIFDGSDPSVTIKTVETTEGSNKKTTSTLVWSEVAANNDGTTIHVELASDQLYLKSTPSYLRVLKIYTQPTDYPLLRGIDMYVYCAFEGPPQPSISWFSHSSPTSAGVEVVDGVVKTTVLNPISTLTVYQSRLTLNVVGGEDSLYRSCKATYSSHSGETIFSGGVLTTRAAQLSLIGISSLSGPSFVTVGAAVTFTAIADFPPEPFFYWTFNDAIVSLDQSTGTRLSSTKFEYVLVKENMQVGDSGSYGVRAQYEEYGTSALKTMTVQVRNTCPQLTEPDNGQLSCNPASYTTETTATCIVTCNNGYSLQTTKSAFTCTDGVWEQNSITNPQNHVTKCLRTVAPSSYTLTVSARYQLPWVASCLDYYGDYLRLSFPYLMAGANPSCVSDGDCYLKDDYFSYSSSSDACFTAGNSVWLKAQYVQNQNTAVDKRNEMFSEISEYLGSVTFDPLALMKTASCVGSCECCILDSCIKAPDTIMSRLKCSSYDRRKRDTGDEQNFHIPDFSILGSAREITKLLETSCSVGSVARGEKCLICPEGTYQEGNQCNQCPTGTFQEQPGSTSCDPCPSRTSNTADGAPNTSCLKECKMRQIRFGTTDPPSGDNVHVGDHVTIVCNEGFNFRGKRVSVIQLKSCFDMLSCRKIEIIASSQDVVVGSRLDLKCKIKSVTSPKHCVFYRDSQQINEIKSISHKDGNFWCTLTLFSIQMGDEGTYSCTAVFDQDGLLDNSINVSIRVLQAEFDAKSTVLKEGTSHSFQCAATVPRESQVIISWIKNGAAVGGRVTSTASSVFGFLNLADLRLEDQGEYRCVATFLGIGSQISKPARLTVFGFTDRLSDVLVVEGTSTTLICNPSIGEVSWTLNDVPLHNASTSLVTSSKDMGIYKCTASYGGVTIVSIATVRVSTSGIVLHPKSRSVKSGDNLELTCGASENVTFSWHVNDTEVSSRITSSARQSTIELFNLTTRSTVQCVVTTTDGITYSSRIATLNVISFSVSPQDTALTEGRVVTLHCSISKENVVSVLWKRTDNEKTIPDSQVDTHNIGHVIRSSMVTSEEGVYFCLAMSEDGLVVQSDRASVTKVQVTISASPVAFGEDTTITCSLRGVVNWAPDAVYWTFNGKIILKDESIDNYKDTNTGIFSSQLYVASISIDHVGTYQCVFYVSKDLNQYKSEPTPIKLLGFVDVLPDIVARKGENVHCTYSIRYHDYLNVTCQVSMGNIETVAGDVVDDVVFYQVQVYNVEDSVQDVQLSCTAHYRANTTINSQTSHIFYLSDPVLTTKSSTVLIGELAVITLTAEFVRKTPTVNWTVNGVSYHQFTSFDSGNIHTSMLYHTVTEDSKIIATILHSDIQNNHTMETFVKVVGVLEVTGPKEALMTDSFYLTCRVAVLDNKTSVKWYHGTKNLEPLRSSFSEGLIISVVFISNFSEEDAGIYSCKARFANENTSVQSFNLTKSDACKVPITENIVVNTTSDTVSDMSAIEVRCGVDLVVLRCQSGVWDQAPPECPSLDKNISVFISIATSVLTVILIVSVALNLHKRHKQARVAAPMTMKKWSENTAKSSILKNPNTERKVPNRKVRFVTQ